MPNDYSPEDARYFEWQVPPHMVSEKTKIGFLNECVEEGQAWIKQQRGYRDFQKALDTISGRDAAKMPASYRSQVNTNRLKRNTREVVGTLAKLRPMWGYNSDNAAYRGYDEMFNKVAKAWYLESMADRKIREALQYAAATCRGWIRPVYRRKMYGTGPGDIELYSYGSPCVLPVQLPSSGNFQDAYVVTILEEMPIAMAHGMFPEKQHLLRPTQSRYWYMSDNVRKSSQGNIMQRIFGKTPRESAANALSDLYVPIRYTYVIDLTINTTKAMLPMGEPGASWYYEVPALGSDIPTTVDAISGRQNFRKADENDARLYPTRRLLISSDQVMLYDGPSFDWHGMLPAVSFCTDDWPWEPLGFSLVHDGFELNEAIKEIVRGNMDKVRSANRPSLAYDTNAVAMAEARAMDPFQPDKRVGYDGSALEAPPFQPILPPEFLKVNPEDMTLVEYLENAMDSQQAISDVRALAKLRAVGSMDDIDKIVEANGPIVEDMSRSMEAPMRDLGIMVKYNILQYYTTTRVMQDVGPDGVHSATFDYDPTSIVPSHVIGESPTGPDNQLRASRYSPRQRAKIFADNLRFFITPNSLHEMSQMVMKLGLIQLKKAGVKIDSQTIAESWSVPNYGDIGGSTVWERWENENEKDLIFAARMKTLADSLGLLPPGASGPGKPNPEGRPPSGNAPPALKSKDGGTRSTITESK